MDLTLHYGAALAVVVATLTAYLYSRPKSVVARITGPPSPSWILGHMSQLILSSPYGEYEFGWQKLYGLAYRIRGCFGEDRLMVSDPIALQYLMNSPTFTRGPVLDGLLSVIFTRKSVLTAKGDEHRRLRSALNVGFTAAAVRDYQPIFENVAESISDQFEKAITVSTKANICPLISTGTLAAISQAVLGSSLEDLGEDFVENNIELCELTATQSKTQLLADGTADHFPVWLWDALMFLPTTSAKVLRRQRYLSDRLGRRVVREKMDAVAKGLEINNDVYSRLLNPEDGTRKLSEADVVAQTSLVVIAGQETTANTLSFALLELARSPDVQDTLRLEIQSMLGAGGSNGYDNMPLLNAVIKETLRLYPAIPLSDKIALEDTVIPLSEPITTATGERMSQIPVRKGQIVTVAAASYQRINSRWGEDADAFNPSRWLDGTVHLEGETLSPYANLLSFNGGPRICLGWRFALLEMQVILCDLVGKFSFVEPENEGVRAKHLTDLLPVAANGDRAVRLHITRLL